MEFSEASQSLTTPHLLLFLISLVGMVFEKENRVPDKPKISMADMLKNKQKSLAEDKFRNEEGHRSSSKRKGQLGARKGKDGAKQR